MTADELRISDGSSDVCSSDLRCAQKGGRAHGLSRIFIASARLFAADRRYQGSRPGCRRNGARIWKAGERHAISRPLTPPPPPRETGPPIDKGETPTSVGRGADPTGNAQWSDGSRREWRVRGGRGEKVNCARVGVAIQKKSKKK